MGIAKRRYAVPLALSLAIATLVAGNQAPEPAQAAQQQEPIELLLAHPDETILASAGDLAEEATEDYVGQSTVRGTTAVGEAFEITTLFAPADSLNVPQPPADSEEGTDHSWVSDDSPELVLETADPVEIIEADAASYIPVSATAITETTFATTWAPVPNAAAYVVTYDEQSWTQIETSFAAGGLPSGFASSVSIDAIDAGGASLYLRLVPVASTAVTSPGDGAAMQPRTY